ncbi:MAG: hypothetical protein ACFFAJ_04690 [Candidatus Hodarchaeota archaeon]
MQLEAAYGIEVATFIDLVRLVTNSSPERPSTIFKWISDERNLIFYGSFAIFPGYYEFEGLPVLFYVQRDSSIEDKDHSIVRYDLQAKENQITFLSHLKESDLENVHTGLIRFCPIVKLKKEPKIFSNLT